MTPFNWFALAMCAAALAFASHTLGALNPRTIVIRIRNKEIPVKANANITIVISPADLAVQDQTLNGKVGESFSGQIKASGGTDPDTFALVDGSGTVPPGLTVNSDGSISGSPSQAGSFTFGVQVTDAQG